MDGSIISGLRKLIAAQFILLSIAHQTINAAPQPGVNEYVTGLDLLEVGEWNDAAAHFTKALQAEPENADYFTARGVAYALGERIAEAQKDLERSNRLRPNHRMTKCWLASVVAMQGRFMEDQLIFPFAGHDEYENTVRRVTNEYGQLAFSKTLNQPLSVQQARPKHEAAKRKFKTLAKGFASRVKPAGAAVSNVLKDRGIKKYRAKDYAGAYRDLWAARLAYPNDTDVLYYYAGCELALGSPEGSRRDYTGLLVAKPGHAYALLGRALAQANLGDGPNARANLALAKKLKPSIGSNYDKQIENKLRGVAEAPPERRAAMLNELFQMVREGKSSASDINNKAVQLIKACQYGRLRSDERYETKLNALRAKANRKRATADDYAALGEFLYTEALLVLGEAVEPGAANRTFRPQTDNSQVRELQMAEAVLNVAIKKNPNHARALAFKAGCRFKLDKDWKSAESYLMRAIDIDSKDPVILEMLARVMDYAAFVQHSAAAGLRSSQYMGEDSWYVYYRRPSEADLRRAAQLESLAKRMWKRARIALDAAIRARPGTAEAHYYTAILAERRKDYKATVVALRKAVALNPRYMEAWQRLDVNAARLGLTDESYQAQSKAVNLVHTSAAPLLKLSWLHLGRTATHSAARVLDQAVLIDASEPRIAAYRGAIAREEGNVQDAVIWFCIASILEEKRLLFAGIRVNDKTGPELYAEQIARLFAINNAAAAMFGMNGAHKQTIMATDINFNMYDRVPQEQKYEKPPYGLLPEVLPDPTRRPEAPTIEAMACWSAVHAGKANAHLKQFPKATQLFQWAAAFESRKPATLDQGMAVRIPGLWAWLGLAEMELLRNNPQAASQHMMRYGMPNIATPDMKKEADRLKNAIEAKGYRSGGDTYQDMLDRRRRRGNRAP